MAILTLLGVLNGLVLLPVLLSLMGPPAEVTPANNASRMATPSPEPLPPPMSHHSYYAGHNPRGTRQQAFSESSDSEYYSETTTTSGIGEEEYKYCDRSAYITPPTVAPTSRILLEASKNPSFPKLTVSHPVSLSKLHLHFSYLHQCISKLGSSLTLCILLISSFVGSEALR